MVQQKWHVGANHIIHYSGEKISFCCSHWLWQLEQSIAWSPTFGFSSLQISIPLRCFSSMEWTGSLLKSKLVKHIFLVMAVFLITSQIVKKVWKTSVIRHVILANPFILLTSWSKTWTEMKKDYSCLQHPCQDCCRHDCLEGGSKEL